MRDLTYPPIILACKTAFRLLGQSIDLQGAEHVPRTGGVLLAVNHVGYVDFIYGGLAANPSGRKVRFMSKRELFDHRWTGPLMRSLHHIEVDRADGEASYRTAVEYLRSGEAVGIFPEATISRAMELKEFKTGAARIAAEAGVPLVPVVLWGTQRLMTKDHPRDFSRGTPIVIRVGEPLHLRGEDPVTETAELRTVMSGMLREAIAAYPADEQPPGSWWLPASYGGGAPSLERAARLDAEEKVQRARLRDQRRAAREQTKK
jgi:1-acyl-sn-glycerol-3-phosphate acyltransferase